MLIVFPKYYLLVMKWSDDDEKKKTQAFWDNLIKNLEEGNIEYAKVNNFPFHF